MGNARAEATPGGTGMAPFAAVAMAPPEVRVEKRADGGFVLRSPQALEPCEIRLGAYLEHWAREAPDRTFLAERSPEGGWRRLTYAEALRAVRSVAQALLGRNLSADRPIMILSDNSIEHGILALAAMHVGVPYASISVAYSLSSQDHAKLRGIAGMLSPGLVFADDGALFAKALEALDLDGVEIVWSKVPPPARAATGFAELAATPPTAEVDRAFEAVGADTVAKILFTSGSTGQPKGVVNTHRMMTTNQQSYRQVFWFLKSEPPVIVDWLPWNHTFGGNSDFNMVLTNGGTLYIDSGKPVPQLIGRTVEALGEISPTIYLNVPRGFDMLIDHLERDRALAETFFRRLRLIFYAGATLPQNLWDRLERLSVEIRGERVPMVSGWGSTETAPMATVVHFPIDRAGVIGLPGPGTEIKFVPNGDKLEMRVRGPCVTPGYWKRPDLTAAAFDEEGYYCIGDAGRLLDPADPSRGIVFDGRTTEDFKLVTGTWVHVGSLRVAAIAAAAPVIQDCVVAGQDREEVGLLVFPGLAGCQRIATSVAPDAPVEVLIAAPEIRAHLEQTLRAYNRQAGGSSRRIGRVLLLAEPPSIDGGEITDKGYINQRAVLTRRAAEVERLYAPDDPAVIRLG